MAVSPSVKTTRKPAANAVEPLVLNFNFERDTKNTKRYAEVGDDPVVGTIYIGKTYAAKLNNPETLTVVIQPGS